MPEFDPLAENETPAPTPGDWTYPPAANEVNAADEVDEWQREWRHEFAAEPAPVDPWLPDAPQPDGEAAPPAPNQLRGMLIEALQTLLLAALLFFAIDFVTARIRVQSISMQPTLYESDYVLVNKLAYRLDEIQRQDIVVFHPPVNGSSEPYIKRVIGMPGDVVRVVGGEVYVNDVLLGENYLAAPPGYQGIWTVPEDSIFVLGDNRNNSSDSHQWGMVPMANIIGEALVVYWPMTHWQVLNAAAATASAAAATDTPATP